MSANPVTRLPRVEYLDGLRGLMCVIVAFGHLFGETKLYILSLADHTQFFSGWDGFYRLVETTPLLVLINGNFATTTFFVMSGYVLVSAFNANSTFFGALCRRFIRLAIPVFVSCLIGLIVLRLGYSWEPANASANADDLIRQGLFSFLATDTATRFLNPPIWSMPTEFVGSVLVLVVTIISRRWQQGALYVLLAFTVLTYGYYVFFMLIGTWIYLICSDQRLRERLYATSWQAKAAVAALVVLLQSAPVEWPWLHLYIPSNEFFLPVFDLTSWHVPGMYPFTSVEFIRGVASVMLIILLLASRPFQNALSKTVFKALGKVSFSLYLVHWPILFTVALPLHEFIFQISNNLSFAMIGSAAMFAVACAVACSVFFRFVEGPAIRLSRNLGKAVDQKFQSLNFQTAG